ncbi:RNA-directed DNA polymerase, eukaryota [Tanacetum coccineum]|uniref:RNA-directed DNA polymerase, eukaryota n=1 Tax=Tanacetum coccineum TaxID=301880 RepID=A0ABQ4XBL7_9ASTR
MNCLSLNVQGLGSKAKKDWIKELNNKHKVNFLFVFVQETKLDCISDMDVKVLWGNYKFEYTISEAVGNSGGILCVWDPSVFRKEHHVVSNNFVALYGSWVSNQAKLLVVSIYAPQSITSKRSLWSYISSLISRWDGHCMVMGDFNEVRCMEDRLGSVYNAQGANEFNSFISNSGLVEIQLEGHLSDHRPILLREVVTDYGPSPFRVYHSWFSLQGFDQMVSETWNNIDLDDNNKMVRFKKKLQILKKEIRSWVNDCKKNQSGRLEDLRSKLCHIDKVIDQGGVNDDILLTRLDLLKKLHDIKSSDARDYMQKAKIQWAIEGDENSIFFHGIINRKRANLAIKGVMVDGEWVDDPCSVKEEFLIIAWKVFLDRLPTRSNLQHRGVLASDLLRPLCSSAQEDSSHLFFSSRLVTDIYHGRPLATSSKGYVESVQYIKEVRWADGGRVIACTQPRRLAVQLLLLASCLVFHDVLLEFLSAIAKKTPAYYWWILLALLGIELSNSAEKAGHISGVHHV